MRRSIVLFLAILLVTGTFVSAAGADNFKPYPATLKGKKIAILLDNQYQVGEAFYAIPRFKEAGAEVKVVSHDVPVAHRFRPTFTHYMKTDITPKEALKTKWDGVVVIWFSNRFT